MDLFVAGRDQSAANQPNNLPEDHLEIVTMRTMRYRDLFERMFKTLRVFAPSSSEFIPFLTCHHSITDFEINAFLNQDSYRLLKFVSDLVSIFDTG